MTKNYWWNAVSFSFRKLLHKSTYKISLLRTKQETNLKSWIFFFLLALGNSGCLNKRYLKNVMHYVSCNSLRSNKKLWNQQKGWLFVLGCELFSGWGHLHWLLNISDCVVFPKYWSGLAFRSNYTVQSTHHPQMHTGLQPNTVRVYPPSKHPLFSSIIISSVCHGKIFYGILRSHLALDSQVSREFL